MASILFLRPSFFTGTITFYHEKSGFYPLEIVEKWGVKLLHPKKSLFYDKMPISKTKVGI